jgi:hypothetical protein
MVKCGELCILHGHEWVKGLVNPVNPARGAFLRTIDCTLVGHGHRTSQHTETSTTGRQITCYSLGCLCQLHPDYAVLNRWNHGFGVLDTTQAGEWRFVNYRILGGKVY